VHQVPALIAGAAVDRLQLLLLLLRRAAGQLGEVVLLQQAVCVAAAVQHGTRRVAPGAASLRNGGCQSCEALEPLGHAALSRDVAELRKVIHAAHPAAAVAGQRRLGSVRLAHQWHRKQGGIN
jgi:hypothetical protein